MPTKKEPRIADIRGGFKEVQSKEEVKEKKKVKEAPKKSPVETAIDALEKKFKNCGRVAIKLYDVQALEQEAELVDRRGYEVIHRTVIVQGAEPLFCTVFQKKKK